MKSNLKFSLKESNGIAEIYLVGDLDATNANDLLYFLRNSVRDSIDKLVFLVEGLEYISSEGFKALILANQETKSEPGVILVKEDSFVSDLIKEAGLEKIFVVETK
ncbi:MAG: STAS domain-containing protein [Bacillota bacterium]